jgi:hypothetical protein
LQHISTNLELGAKFQKYIKRTIMQSLPPKYDYVPLTKGFSTLGDIAKGGKFLTWFLVLPPTSFNHDQ